MIEKQEMVGIEKRDLLQTVASLRSSGYRLVQICSTTLSDCYEMNYSFDKDRQFRNIRFTIGPGETVPSISLIFGNSFLYENEIHDLFGITIEQMVIDYHGTLYETRIPAPFGLKASEPQEGASGPVTQDGSGGTDTGTDKEDRNA
jgi:ech hydrogenase subunit D